MTAPVPRGIRNNNPGNIRWGSPWQGLVPVAEQTDKSFCQFVKPAWGIRALVRVLLTYQDKYSLRTIHDVICRWAPVSENNTTAYIESVCSQTGFAPHQDLNLQDYATMLAMVKAIIQHENGVMPYSATELDEGLKLAGIVSGKTTVKTPVGAAVATATVSGAVAAAMEGANQVNPVVQALTAAADGTADFGQYLRLAGAVLVVLSIAASAFAYWRHSRQLAAVKA